MVEVEVEKDVLSWEGLADMVARLADQVAGDYDVMLAGS